MNAYASVQAPIRKKLDEMVKTWKEPVPGSTDVRPVFPAEITRPIETNLIRFRTLAFQTAQQQQQQRQLGPPMPHVVNGPYATAAPQADWRNTATPPQNNGCYPPANVQGYPPPNGFPQVRSLVDLCSNGLTCSQRSPYPSNDQFPHPQPTPINYQPPYQAPTANRYTYQPPPMEDLHALHLDLENLITTTKLEFAARHWDTGLQTKLKALLDLQSIMRNQQLPPNQIQAIRDQVSQLAQTQPPATPIPGQPPSSMPQPNPIPTPTASTYLAAPPSTIQPSADVQRLLDSNALAEILASARAKQNTPVPSAAPSVPPPPNPPAVASLLPPDRVTTPSSNTSSLLANLKALGMLMPDTSTPNGTISTTQPSTRFTPQEQNNPNTPSLHPSSLAQPLLPQVYNDVELTNASLKMCVLLLVSSDNYANIAGSPRPGLIRAKLFDARPNQCSTCAQRFEATEEGKRKKARHLDWHFRTNRKLAESAGAQHNRSEYVGELVGHKNHLRMSSTH